jgi:hypothetical protein
MKSSILERSLLTLFSLVWIVLLMFLDSICPGGLMDFWGKAVSHYGAELPPVTKAALNVIGYPSHFYSHLMGTPIPLIHEGIRPFVLLIGLLPIFFVWRVRDLNFAKWSWLYCFIGHILFLAVLILVVFAGLSAPFFFI